MRIGIVYHGDEFPPAERIEKQAKSLAADGHEIFLLCNNYGAWPLSEEQVGDVHVLRLRPTLKSPVLNKVLKFPIFFNPLWFVQLLGMIRRFKIEALQVVDIPLSLAVLAAARSQGMPAIFDMWENYPEALRGWAESDWKTLIFKNYRFAKAVERCAVRRFDHIITVVDEQKERLVSLGAPAEKISVVTNAVDADLFSSSVRCETPLTALKDKFKLLYAGGLTIERGLDDIIRALRFLALPDVVLIIAGSGNDEPRLRRIAAEEGMEDRVTFLGQLPFSKIHSYVSDSDLCLVPHVFNECINTTMPNKIFQYMSLGKPLLVSNAKPLARVVDEYDCGWVFESGNPQDAARKIAEAYAARGDLSRGENGKRGVAEKYNWNKSVQPLLDLYRKLSVPGACSSSAAIAA